MCDGMNRLLKLDNARVVVFSTAFDNIGVYYENCQVKDGAFLIGSFGVGKTLNEACHDYLNKISGKTLVFRTYPDSQKEVTILF